MKSRLKSLTCVPRPGQACTIPISSMLLMASRSTLRLTPQRSHMACSVGSMSPGFSPLLMI